MANLSSVIDNETLNIIEQILKDCKCHSLSISVRSPIGPDAEMKTFKLQALRQTINSDELSSLKYIITNDGHTVFACASITKYLVAVALRIAQERAKESIKDNPYADFAQLHTLQLRTIYNEHKDPESLKMCELPGEPSPYHLLTHSLGLPSSNHRILAPDGSPLMAIMELLQDLPGIRGTLAREKLESWTSYSNINYSLVGIMIGALWGGSLNNFMQETLFKPFGMHSTTIGYETNQGVRAGRYLVDSRSNMHPATNLNYRSTGAEAAALGGYTTTHDMDRFLGTLLSAFSNNRAISYITAKFVNESLLQMENERTGDTVHTALGLYTELDSFVIGSLSVNRLLYPDAEFSTYRTAPKATWPQKKTEVYYMAGSAAGCGSASAFMPGGDDKNFAVTVLSNTSGPVDPSDHILRLILRRLANVKERKAGTALHINRPVSVAEHVKNACRTSFSEWERMDAEVRELEKARILPFDISGTFAGRGLSQRLIIDSKADGKLYIIFAGSSAASGPLRLAWLNEKKVKMCVPPHLSPDLLGNGDWAELTFEVHIEGNTVTTLSRETGTETDYFDRTVDVP